MSTAAMPAPAWDAWRAKVFGGAAQLEASGPDFGLLVRLCHHDPEQVSAMLDAGLAEGDALAAEAVRHLPHGPETVPYWADRLRAAQPTAVGPMAIEVATSLFALTGSAEWSTPLLEVVASAETPLPVRIDAARRLAGFPATAALVTAVGLQAQQPEYLVRYHSCNTLLHWGGDLQADLYAHDDLFTLVAAEERPDLWEKAAAELAARVVLP